MDKLLETIKQERLIKGLSQAVLGRRLNMVSSAYGKIERGQTELTLKRLVQICQVLELNSIEFSQLFLTTKISPTMNISTATDLTLDIELDLSRKINYMFKQFVNSSVQKMYDQIMLNYSFTEFTAEDWWVSLGDNKEEQLGMSEKEFWDTFSNSYQEIFKPEDEYDGFKKLVANSDIFYFFKFGLVEDEHLCTLFTKYMLQENTKCYPLNSKLPSKLVSNYLNSLTDLDVYEPQENILDILDQLGNPDF